MSSSLLAVVPITVENVRPVLEKTRNRKKLCSLFGIPANNCDDAATAADYFVNHVTQYKRWKWIIYFLDSIGDTDVAQSIMKYAEPSAGVLTVYFVYIMTIIILQMSIVYL